VGFEWDQSLRRTARTGEALNGLDAEAEKSAAYLRNWRQNQPSPA